MALQLLKIPAKKADSPWLSQAWKIRLFSIIYSYYPITLWRTIS